MILRGTLFHYDPVRSGVPALYGTDCERAIKVLRFNTLWGWKGYAQSNGMAERAVQTLKNILKKSAQSGGDPYIAVLGMEKRTHREYRYTNDTTHGASYQDSITHSATIVEAAAGARRHCAGNPG